MSLVQFPPEVEGLAVPLPDGDYRIYVNSIFNKEKQQYIYDHEVRHILLGHHNQLHRPLALLEEQADDTALLKEEIQCAALLGMSIPVFCPKQSSVWGMRLFAEFTNAVV